MHPELVRLQENYNRILDSYEAGMISYEQATAEIGQANVVDGAGWTWAVDPSSGSFYRYADGYEPEFTDASNFVDAQQMPSAPGMTQPGMGGGQAPWDVAPGMGGSPYDNDGFTPMGAAPTAQGAKRGGKAPRGPKAPRQPKAPRGGGGGNLRTVILIALVVVVGAGFFLAKKHSGQVTSTTIPGGSLPTTVVTTPATVPPTTPTTRPVTTTTRVVVTTTQPIPTTSRPIPTTTRPVTTTTRRVTTTTRPVYVAPSAPNSISALSIGGAVRVSWSAVNGHGLLVHYTATATTGASCTTTTTSCVISGLTVGVRYQFTVQAFTKAGSSAPSPLSPVVVVTAPQPTTTTTAHIAVPGSPQGVHAVGGGASATITWAAEVSSGAGVILRYTATASPGGQSCTVPYPQTLCVVGGLTDGTAYVFTVTATNVSGTSSPSSPTNSVVPHSSPGAPLNVVASLTGQSATTAIVTWSAPASSGGYPITSYSVSSSPAGLGCTSTTTSCVVAGLAFGQSYTFTVVAHNQLGAGSPGSTTGSITPFTTPSAPTGVTATTTGATTVRVNWTAGFNGGSPITKYVVRSNTGKTCTTTGLSCTITGLSATVYYIFTVVAYNAAGASPASSSSNSVKGAAPRPSALFVGLARL